MYFYVDFYVLSVACEDGQWTFVVLVVVVAFSSHAGILGECSTIHSPPVLFF